MRGVELVSRGPSVGASMGVCDNRMHLEGAEARTDSASHQQYADNTAALSCDYTGGLSEGRGPIPHTASDPSSASLSLGLRVAVCDVNVGAATAAGLICKYVLPHMERACVCHCSSSSSSARSRDAHCADMSASDSSSNSNSDSNSGSSNKGKHTSSSVSNDEGSAPTSNTTSCSTSSPLNNRTASHTDSHPVRANCNCCGYIVLTLKLVKNAKESYIARAVEAACGLLSQGGCWDYRVVHLGANSRNERTLVCRCGGRGGAREG